MLYLKILYLSKILMPSHTVQIYDLLINDLQNTTFDLEF